MHSVLADIQHLPLFVLAGLLLNITPGVDMALVLRSSAAQGFRAGAAAVLGISAGCSVHIAAAALGVSAVLAGSPTAFMVLQWLGAAYLVWLGSGLLRSQGSGQAAGVVPANDTKALRRLLAQGFLTNALNPKVALFFLAFVPQFIAAQPARPALAFVLLGGVFVFNSTLVNLAIAAAAAALRSRLAGQARWQRLGPWLNRGAGALFIALGLKLALDLPGR
ncbi:MAG: LysE family translocator [Aquabacterium sp.]|nr:LysE family translocator [Aquabacterium sp.]